MRWLAPVTLGFLVLGGCAQPGEEFGDMTKSQAVKSCQQYVSKHHTGEEKLRFENAEANKDDVFWEVRGQTSKGSYRCTVDAVDHQTFTATFDK